MEGPCYCLGKIRKGISMLAKPKLRHMRSEKKTLASWKEMGEARVRLRRLQGPRSRGSKSVAFRGLRKFSMVGGREMVGSE